MNRAMDPTEVMGSDMMPIWMVGLSLIAALIGAVFYGRFCGVSAGRGLLFGLIGLVASVGLILQRWRDVRQGIGSVANNWGLPFEGRVLLPLAGIVLFVFSALPLAVKLYRKWVEGQVTSEEMAVGQAGVKAWLGGGNLAVAVMLAAGGWLGFGWSPLGTLTLAVAALLIYPLGKTALQAVTPAPPQTIPGREDLSGQRERVLRMLEEGKITASESADLLNALGQPDAPPRPVQGQEGGAVSGVHRLAIVGAALVLIGFCLPWFTINTERELDRMLGGLQQSLGGAMTFQQSFTDSEGIRSIRIGGGQINLGLGWVILLAGLGALVIPYLQLKVDQRTQRLITWGVLGVGGFLILYLVTQNLRFVSIGIVLVMVGYVFEAMGLAREQIA